MSKKIVAFLSPFVAAVLLGMLAAPASFARVNPDKSKRNWGGSLYKTNGSPRYQILNINNLWTWLRSDGQSNHSPTGDNGTFYPRGTAFLIYQDGVMWGGKAYVDQAKTQSAPFGQLIRVGGANYITGCREGRIIGEGANAVAANPGDPDARIYRIRRDYYTMSETELKRDAAESFEKPAAQVTESDMQKIFDQYAKDWQEWPVDYGAPFIDRNGNGVYDPPPPFSANFTADSLIAGGYDEPGVAGADPNSPADQVVWTVYNDLDRNQTITLQGSEPLGLEVQVTEWGYKRTDPLGNIFFRRIRIINKGGVDIDGTGTKGSFWIDSMYVAQWADPDLGSFADDLVGCDTTLSIGFVYNGNAVDSDYRKFNLPPPSGGYDFLQGPIVPSPGDSAVFDLKRRHGYKNLGMSSFSYFSAGSAISDPPRDYTRGTLRWYKMLRGYAPVDGPLTFYPFPPGMTPGPFPLSGDPVTQTGFIDGQGQPYSFAPGDRRLNVSTGPFTLAPGDTQEVVVALVAGLGADRLSSVAVMKFNDRFAQNTYDALFQVPKPPSPPHVVVTELDGEVVLEWGSDVDRIQDTETRVREPGGYAFEGYNVYQFPSRTASLKDAKRIVTYDLVTDPAVILDERFDTKSGQILQQPVQFGSNSGIKRFFRFNRDYVLDIDKIYNGQEYYLAVTAYSHATVPGFLPASLESSPTIITVRPKVPFGALYKSAYGDTLPVEHVSGTSDGAVRPIVIDPTASPGATYQVRFDTTGGETTWKVENKSTGQVLLANQKNQSGDDDYTIVDGLFLKVEGPPLAGKSWSADPNSDRWFTGGFDGELLFGGVYLAPNFTGSSVDPANFKTVEIRFVAKTGFTDLNGNGTYDIGEPYTMPAEGTQKAFMYQSWDDNTYEGFFDVPFTAWDVQDPSNPRQLNVVVRDRDGNHQWDLHSKVDDPNLPNGGDLRYNYVWIAATDYDPTGTLHASPAQGGTGWTGDFGAGKPGLWVLWLRQRGSREPYGKNVTLTLVPNFINTVNDVFEFTTPAPETGLQQEMFSAEHVGVFPNPYYAFNPAETNRLSRFVTFNNLPPKVTIRIFNLGGQLVRTLTKDDPSQFMKWDLLNHTGTPVASGMYLAEVEMELPSGGKFKKVLKLAIIQEQEVLDVY